MTSNFWLSIRLRQDFNFYDFNLCKINVQDLIYHHIGDIRIFTLTLLDSTQLLCAGQTQLLLLERLEFLVLNLKSIAIVEILGIEGGIFVS